MKNKTILFWVAAFSHFFAHCGFGIDSIVNEPLQGLKVPASAQFSGSFSSIAGSNTHTLTVGSSAGLGAVQDQLYFACRDAFGNTEIEAKFDLATFRINGASIEGKEGGLMLRSDQSANAAFAAIAFNDENEVTFRWRSSSGAISAKSFATLPVGGTHGWLRLVRSGSFYAGYYSLNGFQWTLVGASVAEIRSSSLGSRVKSGVFASVPSVNGNIQVQVSNLAILHNVPQKGGSLARAPIRLWLRSDDGIETSNGAISKWKDQSGFTNDAVSESVSGAFQNQPTVLQEAINGKPSILFGADATTTKLKILDHATLRSAQPTLFVVAKWDASLPPNARILSKGNKDTPAYSLRFSASKPSLSTSTSIAVSSLLPDITKPHLMVASYVSNDLPSKNLFRNSGLNIFTDNYNLKTVTNHANDLIHGDSPLWIGHSSAALDLAHQFRGQFAEIILFDGQISLDRYAEISAYLSQKYGLNDVLSPSLEAPNVLFENRFLTDNEQMLVGTTANLEFEISVPDNGEGRYRINGGDWIVYNGKFVLGPNVSKLEFQVRKPGFHDSPILVLNLTTDPLTGRFSRQGLNLWLRADVGVTKNASNLITRWVSQTPTPLAAEQTVLANAPTYLNSSLGLRPAVSFSRTSQKFMRISSAASLLNFKEHTAFIVSEFNATLNGDFHTLISKASTTLSSARSGYFIHWAKSTTENSTTVNSIVSNVARMDSATALTSSWRSLSTAMSSGTTSGILGLRVLDTLREVKFRGSVMNSVPTALIPGNDNTLQQDRVVAFNPVPGGFKSSENAFFIGVRHETDKATTSFTGRISEILLFDRRLESKEFREVESYLAERYALQLPKVRLEVTPASSFSTTQTVRFYSPDLIQNSSDPAQIFYQVTGPNSEPTPWQPIKNGNTIQIGSTTATQPGEYVVTAYAEKNGFIRSDTVSRTFTQVPSTDLVSRENLKMWLRADYGITTLAGSANVSQWRDLSGCKNNLVRDTTLSASPIYSTPDEAPKITFGPLVNGSPVLTRMLGTTGFSLGSHAGGLDKDLMIVLVGERTSGNNLVSLCEYSSSPNLVTSSWGILLRLAPSSDKPSHCSSRMSYRSDGIIPPQIIDLVGSGPTSKPNLFVQMFRPDLANGKQCFHKISINDISQSASDEAFETFLYPTGLGNSLSYQFSLGASRLAEATPFQGNIFEVLVYDKPLDSRSLYKLKHYLAKRYSIQKILANSDQLTPPHILAPAYGVQSTAPELRLSHEYPEAVLEYRYASVNSEDDSFTTDYPSWQTYTTPPHIELTGLVRIEARASAPLYAPSAKAVQLCYIDRSSISIPRDGLKLWLAADKGVELKASPSTEVTNWKDLSGLANGFEMNSGTFTFGNKTTSSKIRTTADANAPVVRFTVTDKAFITNSQELLNSGEVSMFCVTAANAPSANNSPLHLSLPRALIGGQAGTGFHVIHANGDLMASTRLGTAALMTRMSPSTTQRATLYFAELGNSESAALRYWPNEDNNGWQTAEFFPQNPPPSIQTGSRIHIGGGGCNTDLAEVLIYDRKLTEQEQMGVFNYLRGKYKFGYQEKCQPPTILIPTGLYADELTLSFAVPEESNLNYRVNESPNAGLALASGVHRVTAYCTRPGFAPSPEVSALIVIDENAKNLPNSLKEKIKMHLRADAGVTRVDEVSQKVKSWADLTGDSGLHNSSNGVANKPVWLEQSPDFNNKPVVCFGSSDGLATFLRSVNNDDYDIEEPSLVVVMKPNGASTPISNSRSVVLKKHEFKSNADGTNQLGYRLSIVGTETPAAFSGEFETPHYNSQLSLVPPGGAASPFTAMVLGGAFSSKAQSLYHNLNEAGMMVFNPPKAAIKAADQRLLLGSGFDGSEYTNPFFGDVAEVILLDEPMTLEERYSLNLYLNNRYGLNSGFKLPRPVATPDGGLHTSEVFVSLKSYPDDAQIRYVIGNPGEEADAVPSPSLEAIPPLEADGSPSRTLVYQPGSTFLFTPAGGKRVIKAIALKIGYLSSDEATFTYDFDPEATFARAGLLVWLKAGTGVITDTNNAVRKWLDLSGNGNHAELLDQTLAPRLVPNNQFPSVQFKATTASDEGSVGFRIPSPSSYRNKEITLVAVMKQNEGGTGMFFHKNTNHFSVEQGVFQNKQKLWLTDRQFKVSAPSDKFFILIASAKTVLGAQGALISRNWFVRTGGEEDMVSFGDGTSSYLNDKKQSFVLGCLRQTVNGKKTNTRGFSGELAELMVYDYAMTPTQRGAILSYLYRTYGEIDDAGLSSPVFWPMNDELGGPSEVALLAPPHVTIRWTDNPDPQLQLTDWRTYTEPIFVPYSTTLRAFSQELGILQRVSREVKKTYLIDATKFPPPDDNIDDTEPPEITLERPTNAEIQQPATP